MGDIIQGNPGKNPKGSGALLVCGFFDHEGIQEELVRRGLKLDKHGTNILE